MHGKLCHALLNGAGHNFKDTTEHPEPQEMPETLGRSAASDMDTGNTRSAYQFQGGEATVTGTFPYWPESSYLRPNPVCKFGSDATPLASTSHSRTQVVCQSEAVLYAAPGRSLRLPLYNHLHWKMVAD